MQGTRVRNRATHRVFWCQLPVFGPKACSKKSSRKVLGGRKEKSKDISICFILSAAPLRRRENLLMPAAETLVRRLARDCRNATRQAFERACRAGEISRHNTFGRTAGKSGLSPSVILAECEDPSSSQLFRMGPRVRKGDEGCERECIRDYFGAGKGGTLLPSSLRHARIHLLPSRFG